MPPSGTYHHGAEPIPGYRLDTYLGSGLVGEVWSAEDVAAGRTVAVKFVDLTFAGGAVGDLGPLALLTSLTHANLLPVYTVRLRDRSGRELDRDGAELARQRGDLKELVMVTALASKSLSDRLREENPSDPPPAARVGLPLAELVRYMERAAAALDYLNAPDHGLGPGDGSVVHGDMKPRNLMLVGGELQIADAGLYALYGSAARRQLAVVAPAYTTPELAANQAGPRSDQYGLAVCYHELRTGRLPFDAAKGHADIILAHAQGRLDFSAPVLTAGEREVLVRATAMNPADRYPSCAKLVQALSRAVEDLYPPRSTRVLHDSKGEPYPSPRRRESYWSAILPESAGPVSPAEIPPLPASDPDEPPPTDPSVDLPAVVALPTHMLSAANVRATPVLLPLEPPPAPPRRGPLVPAERPWAAVPPPPPPAPSPPPELPPYPTPAREGSAAVLIPPSSPSVHSTPKQELPAWYPRSDPVSAGVGPQGAVYYAARARPGRAFPLVVDVPPALLRRVTAGANVTVEPVLPGCGCYPPREVYPPGPDGVRATFLVVPLGRGRVTGARVEVKAGAEVLAEIPIDVTVTGGGWGWGLAAAGVVLPLALAAAQGVQPLTAASDKGLPSYVGDAGAWLIKKVSPDAVAGVLLAAAGGVAVWHRPRRREDAWEAAP